MHKVVPSYRTRLGLCAAILGAVALAQVVIVLLHYWPSSTLLWVLYFEFAKRLDSVFRFARDMMGVGTIDFLAFAVAALFTVALLSVRARLRFLEALLLHGSFLCALLILLDNLKLRRDTGLSTTFVEFTPGLAGVLVLFAIWMLPLAAACLRVHARYIELAFKRSH